MDGGVRRGEGGRRSRRRRRGEGCCGTQVVVGVVVIDCRLDVNS